MKLYTAATIILGLSTSIVHADIWTVDDDGKAVRVDGVSPDVIQGTGSLSHLPWKYGPDSPLEGTIYRELGRGMEKRTAFTHCLYYRSNSSPNRI